MSKLRVGMAQIDARLGDLEANVRAHRQLLAQARGEGVDLLVFPELGLTGYMLQDLNAEVAMRADDPRLLDLAEAAGPDLSMVVGFVEESADHRLYVAAALLEEGRVAHVVRKAYLPSYGLFDERRFFGGGEVLRAVDSRLGLRMGISICEDFWHLGVPLLHAFDGAHVLVNISSSPGRDVAAAVEGGLGTAESWRPLLRTYAMLTGSYVVFVNRVGVEESVTFWGGSEVVDPGGQSAYRAPLHDEGLFVVEIDTDEVRRQRVATPLMRDERPELLLRQLERVIRSGGGLPDDTWPGG
ncbi:MAG TPA: nitrilase-related carbon-nitrogen hydrolase [Candidatus Limnocylindrales bacterium]|nr:nitrilase-related carbon-nitrogen hydrolase [Candidatus Limnocylindrales bacterium]